MHVLKYPSDTSLDAPQPDTPVLYMWDDISLLIKRSPKKVRYHSLMIDTFVMNLEKDYYVSHEDSERWSKCRSVFWPSYAKHKWKSEEVMAFIFIEPNFIYSSMVRGNMLQDESLFYTKLCHESYATEAFRYIYENHPEPDLVYEMLTSVLVSGPTMSNSVPYSSQKFDKRVLKLMSIIREQPEINHSIRDLASMVCLSESRIEHIFKNEMNMPITHYRKLWRIKAASGYVQKFKCLTAAALEAGFNDLPHFSNVFRQFSGMTPGSIYGPNSTEPLKIISSCSLTKNFE